VKNALTRLKRDGRAVDVDRGVWAHPDHVDALAEDADLANAA